MSEGFQDRTAGLPDSKPIPQIDRGEGVYLNLGESWFPPAPGVIRVLEHEMARLHRYPDNQGTQLRECLAEREGVSVGQILLGNGSDGLIELLVKTFVPPGACVWAPAPTFFVYGHAAGLLGAKVAVGGRCGLGEGCRLQPGAWKQLEEKPALVFLANPNNPTGLAEDEGLLKELLEESQALVVVDECYFGFCESTLLPWLERYPHLVVLRSFSKSHALAGLRLGYLAAGEKIVRALMRADQTFSVNRLALAAGVAALAEEESYYRPLWRETVLRRDRWAAELRGLGLEVLPSGSNFLFAHHHQAFPGSLASVLAQERIFVADFHGKGGLQSCFRAGLGTEAEVNILQDALKRILA